MRQDWVWGARAGGGAHHQGKRLVVEQLRCSWACGLEGSLVGASSPSHNSGLQLGPASFRVGHGRDMAAISPGPWVSNPTHRSCFLPFLTRGCHSCHHKQVWVAHPFLLWPHQSRYWRMENSRWWWSAWSLMLHPLALTAPSGSQPATVVHWMPSPMALPQQRMAPGPAWPISPCPLRSWHPGRLWSATLGLGLRATAGVHSPCSCQERLLQPGPAPGSLSGGCRAGSCGWGCCGCCSSSCCCLTCS
ncbi:pre T-cell antigen receptor alpha isoform X2 [Macaca nemestrina]|uniref:pre T-cell antigen receptor alpha isoform X2 n=1 Tax=Macaca nemestrina TaxID=9545 RepID=UPI0039B81F0F